MNTKHLSKLCSIDSSLKNGRTRLKMNEKDFYEYFYDCIAEDEREMEEIKFLDKQLKFSY